MSNQSIFERIMPDLRQAIIQNLKNQKEVDRLYLENKLPLLSITSEVPSEENIDFDYTRLTFINEGEHVHEENQMHRFKGIRWKLPCHLVRNGHQSTWNKPGGEIGGIVKELLVKVSFDQVTGEPYTEVEGVEQTVYIHLY